MKEQLITLETAKLAREKGFDWKCNYFYSKDGYVSYLKPNREYEHLHSEEEEIESYFNGQYNWNSLNDKRVCLKTSFSECDEWYDCECSAPTQSLLQKWLRDVHMIFVNPNYDHIRNDGSSYVKYGVMTKSSNSKEGFDTYEQALEVGLLEALKLIKNDK